MRGAWPALLAALLLSACSTIETRHRDWSRYTGPGAEYFGLADPPPLHSLADPGEPTNRTLQALNVGLLEWVVDPLARGWRAITTPGVRTHIDQFGTNLAFPVRLFGTLFQARWSDAGSETGRFVINTTVGLLGFFDPAEDWGLPAPRPQDVGLTLGQWGWTPQVYVMLPVEGPSSDRDTVGFVGDTALDPATYLFPLSIFLRFNTLSDRVDTFLRLDQSLEDSYSIVRQVWTLYRSRAEADMSFVPEAGPSIDTLEAVFLSYRDPGFPRRADVRTLLVPTTGRRLAYDLWLQPQPAPIVYILPGLGSYRESDSTIALAEMAWVNGYSAVTLSSALNGEFMAAASSMAVPGYAPVDAHDVHRVLTAIDADLRRTHPERLTQRALLGLSLGAFHTLYIAAANRGADTGVSPAFVDAAADEPLLDFDAYVPINPPVRLRHGVEVLDEFYRAPLEWPAAGREQRIENILLKVLNLARGDLSPGLDLPFGRIESSYLVGLTFRIMLRDILWESQSRDNLGVLLTPLDSFDRQPAYDEINAYSWMEYFYAFALPYLRERDPALGDPEVLWGRCELSALRRQLAADPAIRVFTNSNDFLLAQQDRAWLQDTFNADGSGRLQFFDNGGHLGNLYRPEIQAAIMGALTQRLLEAQAATSLDFAAR